MATARQQTPFIGSKVSLISKMGIRYEGILYMVDVAEGTVALAKARSFGTEDRPTSHPIAVHHEVYEYIILRVTDIKEIAVCQPPQPALGLYGGLPYDPAIVSISPKRSTESPNFLHIAGSAPFKKWTPSRGGAGESNVQFGSPDAVRVQQFRPGANRLPTVDLTKNMDAFNQMFLPRNEGIFRNERTRRGRLFGEPLSGAGDGVAQPGMRRFSGDFRYFNRRGNQNLANIDLQKTGVVDKPKKILKFNSDYDLEKANEMFKEFIAGDDDDVKDAKNDQDKSEKANTPSDEKMKNTETAERPDLKKGLFYDKKISFFDRISCQSLDKPENRQPRFAPFKMRETNRETFGNVTSHPPFGNMMPHTQFGNSTQPAGYKGKRDFGKQRARSEGRNCSSFDEKKANRSVGN